MIIRRLIKVLRDGVIRNLQGRGVMIWVQQLHGCWQQEGEYGNPDGRKKCSFYIHFWGRLIRKGPSWELFQILFVIGFGFFFFFSIRKWGLIASKYSSRTGQDRGLSTTVTTVHIRLSKTFGLKVCNWKYFIYFGEKTCMVSKTKLSIFNSFKLKNLLHVSDGRFQCYQSVSNDTNHCWFSMFIGKINLYV